MTTQRPTPADVKTLADNMRTEGQTSRADVLDNVAKEMAALFLYVERLRAVEAAARLLHYTMLLTYETQSYKAVWHLWHDHQALSDPD